MGRGTQARRTAAGGRASNRVTKKGVAIAAAPTIMNHMKLTEDNKADIAIFALITIFLVLLFVMNA